jgi:hypothetical protein
MPRSCTPKGFVVRPTVVLDASQGCASDGLTDVIEPDVNVGAREMAWIASIFPAKYGTLKFPAKVWAGFESAPQFPPLVFREGHGCGETHRDGGNRQLPQNGQSRDLLCFGPLHQQRQNFGTNQHDQGSRTKDFYHSS